MTNQFETKGPIWDGPLWKRALLFQSMRQFTSCALIISLVSLAMQQLFAALGGTQVPPIILILAVASGTLQSVVRVLKGMMTLTPGTAATSATLDNELRKLGYSEGETSEGKLIYRQKLPRWLLWDESNMETSRAGGRIVLRGPYFALKKLKKTLDRAG